VSHTLTPAQLKNGGRAIAYRAWQLANVVALNGVERILRDPAPAKVLTITNALVESALVNSRALAYFFADKSRKNVNASMFHSPDWQDDDLVKVAAKVEKPVSRHLSLATTGAKQGEPHPGAWPLPELAVVLVRGLARFVPTLTPERQAWFTTPRTPSPVETAHTLIALDPLAAPTPISDNRYVARLTRALQTYLEIA
jgi:hypothetical protein